MLNKIIIVLGHESVKIKRIIKKIKKLTLLLTKNINLEYLHQLKLDLKKYQKKIVALSLFNLICHSSKPQL